MCGLTAIFDPKGRLDIDEVLLNRMTDRLAHRGPDGRGTFIDTGIGLGHRRLSIIDVEGGIQPMFAEQGQVALVFNGEIYNFQSVAETLKEQGVVFDTRSDTEVILKSWLTWGRDCVKHLEGMFTIVIWDARDETFFMARDRLGKKPLYHSVLSDGSLIVGSELKALMCHPLLDMEIDTEAVEDFFAYGYIPDPKSIFKRVKKLPAATTLYWQRGNPCEIKPYWEIPLQEVGCEFEFAKETLIKRLDQSISGRLISDVPLGAFLSGGVDSSAVVAAMSKQSTEPVKTFSIGFGDAVFDESRFAEKVANQYQTDHHLTSVDPDDFSLLDELGEMFDEPFGDSSALPTYRVCEAARKHVTVCLSGDGGDEIFGGYRRHRFHLVQETFKRKIPASIRKPVFGMLAKIYPKADWAPRFLRAKATFQELAISEEEAYFNSVSAMSEGDRSRLFSPAFREELGGYAAINVVQEHFADAKSTDPLRRAQYVDLKTWLPGDILVKVDRTSMAISLEVRAPFLDYKMAEFGLSLPSVHKISGGEGKHVLKQAMLPSLSREILYRQKQGFSVPLAKWFRGPLKAKVHEALLGDRLRQTGFFDADVLAKMASEHSSGIRDHARAIWLLLVFDVFLKSLQRVKQAEVRQR